MRTYWDIGAYPKGCDHVHNYYYLLSFWLICVACSGLAIFSVINTDLNPYVLFIISIFCLFAAGFTYTQLMRWGQDIISEDDLDELIKLVDRMNEHNIEYHDFLDRNINISNLTNRDLSNITKNLGCFLSDWNRERKEFLLLNSL